MPHPRNRLSTPLYEFHRAARISRDRMRESLALPDFSDDLAAAVAGADWYPTDASPAIQARAETVR